MYIIPCVLIKQAQSVKWTQDQDLGSKPQVPLDVKEFLGRLEDAWSFRFQVRAEAQFPCDASTGRSLG